MTRIAVMQDKKEYSRVLVPVSGGKDSQMCVVKAIEEFGRDKVTMAHQNTGFDHPVTYKHMDYMVERYGVPLIQIYSDKYKTVPDVMYGEAMIPSRFARMCTRQLKTGPWFKWLSEQPDRDTMLVLLGMRAAEGKNRRENYGHLSADDPYEMGDISSECPASCRHVPVRLPIVDVTTPSVFAFLRNRGDKLNPLYKRGHTRVGCYPCIMAGPKDFILASRDPTGRKHLGELQQAITFVKGKRPDLDTGFFPHDLVAMLEKQEADPFGFNHEFAAEDDAADQGGGGCSWCNL